MHLLQKRRQKRPTKIVTRLFGSKIMIPFSCSRTVLGLTLVPILARGKSKKDIILQDPPVNLIESLQKKTHAKSGERSVERTGHRQEKQYPISTQNIG